MLMVRRSLMGFSLVIADLNGTARIKPWPLSWHTSALTTELQEVMPALALALDWAGV